MATRLKSVRARDFRGFKVLNFAPTGHVVRFEGGNGSGKTDAILALLAPVDPGAIDGDPVTYGQPRGSVEHILQTESGRTLAVERSWRQTKAGKQVTEITIKEKVHDDWLVQPDVKPILELLFGPFTDVRQFLKVRTPTQERELGDELLKSGGVSVAAMDARLLEITEKRRRNKAELTSTEARLNALNIPRPGLPDAEVSVAGRAAEIAEWRRERTAYETESRALERLATNTSDAAERVTRLTAELAAAKLAVKSEQKKHDEAKAIFEKKTVPPSLDQIAEAEEALGGLEETNGQIRRAAAWRELRGETDTLAAKDVAFNKELDEVRAEKLKALREAKLPIPDLAVTEEGTVTYEGIGLHELSEGQKLVVGVAIALATIGKLQAVFVDGGESIDAKNEAKAIAMCKKADVVLFIAETAKESPELVIRGAEWDAQRAKGAA